jgi:hypothetical protein
MSSKYRHTSVAGSNIARNGFINETDVITKFNNWKIDLMAQECLVKMGYILSEIKDVVAIKIKGSYKADVQVQVTIYFIDLIEEQNISIKLVSNPNGFNQIDKRWVKNYVEMWSIPDSIQETLKLYTGENILLNKNSRDNRRMFFDEMEEARVSELINFISTNKILIVSDILKGRGKFSADWMLVVLKADGAEIWGLKSINEAMNIFGKGDVVITKQGNLKIGKIGMQRKGGDGGRDTAKMLQFKINPTLLIDKQTDPPPSTSPSA